jgi:hypothetical protein
MISDETFLKFGLYLVLFAFLYVLGTEKHPGFFIFAGVIGLMFAFELYGVIGSLVISGILAAVSIVIMTYGFVKKPDVKET